jgi:hypothetical protein
MIAPTTIPARASARRHLFAAVGIAVIALLPLIALLLPVAPSAAAVPQRLIVLLPAGAEALPQAAALLDAAQARPLGQGAWPGLWLVATAAPDATARLYEAGAHLVLAGDGLLAGCLSFRSLPPARKAS